MEKIRKVEISLGTRKVEAVAVGGEEGVFAARRNGNIITLYSGDDGHWSEMASYHIDWLPSILAILKRVGS